MHTQPAQQFLSSLAFNTFDLFALIWLVIGLFRGRKLGMSQELLPMFKWISIVVVAGLFYAPVAVSVHQNTGSFFSKLGANLTAYCLISLLIMLVFVWIKKAIGEKLTGSDLFGSYEYYLGMVGGFIRFACMLIVLMALMCSRIYTKAENDAYEAEQKKQLDNSFIPSYGQIQYQVLTLSFTGKLVRQNLPMLMIKSVTADDLKKGETPAQKSNDQLKDILDSSSPKK
jgi:uncharacterized membrane protein required for colicin V production